MSFSNILDSCTFTNKTTLKQCIQIGMIIPGWNMDCHFNATYRLIFTIGSRVTRWRRAQTCTININKLGFKTQCSTEGKRHMLHLIKHHPCTLQSSRKHAFYSCGNNHFTDISSTIYDRHTYMLNVMCFLEIDLRKGKNILYGREDMLDVYIHGYNGKSMYFCFTLASLLDTECVKNDRNILSYIMDEEIKVTETRDVINEYINTTTQLYVCPHESKTSISVPVNDVTVGPHKQFYVCSLFANSLTNKKEINKPSEIIARSKEIPYMYEDVICRKTRNCLSIYPGTLDTYVWIQCIPFYSNIEHAFCFMRYNKSFACLSENSFAPVLDDDSMQISDQIYNPSFVAYMEQIVENVLKTNKHSLLHKISIYKQVKYNVNRHNLDVLIALLKMQCLLMLWISEEISKHTLQQQVTRMCLSTYLSSLGPFIEKACENIYSIHASVLPPHVYIDLYHMYMTLSSKCCCTFIGIFDKLLRAECSRSKDAHIGEKTVTGISMHLYNYVRSNGYYFETSVTSMSVIEKHSACPYCKRELQQKSYLPLPQHMHTFSNNDVTIFASLEKTISVYGLSKDTCPCNSFNVKDPWKQIDNILHPLHRQSFSAFLLDYMKLYVCDACNEDSCIQRYMKVYVNLASYKSLKYLHNGGIHTEKMIYEPAVNDMNKTFPVIGY